MCALTKLGFIFYKANIKILNNKKFTNRIILKQISPEAKLMSLIEIVQKQPHKKSHDPISETDQMLSSMRRPQSQAKSANAMHIEITII